MTRPQRYAEPTNRGMRGGRFNRLNRRNAGLIRLNQVADEGVNFGALKIIHETDALLRDHAARSLAPGCNPQLSEMEFAAHLFR